VAEGGFREDLYYRLNVVTITLPPLRERGNDVFELAEYLLESLSLEMEMANPGLTEDAKEFLASHTWPGNVRELSNTLQKALIFNRGAPLTRAELVQAVGLGQERAFLHDGRESDFRDKIQDILARHAGENAFELLMDYAGRLVISEALEITGGNRTRAARLLGMSRPTLAARIEKYGLKTRTSIS
jgi:transcriptional regulator with PAS, ATPase and Fis domain